MFHNILQKKTIKSNREKRDHLVDLLSEVLNRLCKRNDHFICDGNTPVTRFHAMRAPQITIDFYLKRIAQYSNCSAECFILALIYIDRLMRRNSRFLVNSLTVHRLIITSIMLGAKFFDDQFFSNAYFGEVGGVSSKEINMLEIDFLFMINFNLHVESNLYKTYNERLLTLIQSKETEEQDYDAKMPGSASKVCCAAPGTSESSGVLKASQQQEHERNDKVLMPLGAAPSTEAKQTEEDNQFGLRSSSSAMGINAQHVISSKHVSPPVTTRIRHRCTGLSPKFLLTTGRIRMETH